jgi:GT2 family glycosyltransferase
MTKATAIIPTKSNFEGLKKIVSTLENDEAVETIVVIADGEETFSKLQQYVVAHPKVKMVSVTRGVGIHVMWNLGLEVAEQTGTHALLINDDVESDSNTATIICEVLDSNDNIGLVCPNYDNRKMNSDYQEVYNTAGGRYDGTGGLAGFYMGFRNDLVSKFRFNEGMKWYFGDDDILHWTRFKNHKTVITSRTKCWGNESKTLKEYTPVNFQEDVKTDQQLYEARVFIRDAIGRQ